MFKLLVVIGECGGLNSHVIEFDTEEKRMAAAREIELVLHTVVCIYL